MLRLAATCVVTLVAPVPAQTPTAPNIVVILADDAGWADFGFQPACAADAKALTPHIDSIAAAGARFDAAYVTGAVCSPSRAGLLTGRYQQRFGHDRNIPAGYMEGGLDLGERTIADRLSELSYTAGMVGKWHLGYPNEYHPNRRGFNWFFGLLQGARPYRALPQAHPHRVLQENGVAQPEVGYVTDRFGAAAARYIAEHAESPFFLYVAFTATHGPLQPLEADVATLPESIPQRRRNNLGLMIGLDRAVGVILDALEERGLTQRTLVVFTNDNGGQTQTGAKNGPLRGRKSQVWEGGIRVPMAVRWPGRVAPGTAIEDPVMLFDLLPTFVAAGGGQTSPEWKLDGVDLGPRLRGEVKALAPRPLFWRTQGSKGPIAMREGDWKLVHERGTDGARPQLFDLSRDLGEKTDVSADHEDRVTAMLAALKTWESQLIEPRWGGRDD